jgi:hypothetical protein
MVFGSGENTTPLLQLPLFLSVVVVVEAGQFFGLHASNTTLLAIS